MSSTNNNTQTGETASSSDQLNTIINLIKKLNHELEEIRLRSLNNLFSKLDNNVIHEVDLVQHRQLFINLFEWFNRENAKEKDKVLDLLFKLSNYESSVKIIQEIGGLQFLNSLKQNLNDNAELIDKVGRIIERLLEVSSSLVNNESSATTTSNYIKKLSSLSSKTITSTTETLTNEDNEATPRNPSFMSSQAVNDHQKYSQILSNSVVLSKDITSSIYQKQTTVNTIIETTQSQIGNVFSQTINSLDLNSQIKYALNDTEFNQNQNNNSNIFYWIPLTMFDRNFLQNALNSVKSNDTKTIKSYCSFLQNIVFNDFPVEIFLQRSEIIKVLMELLVTTTDDDLLSSIISCLHYFCIKLRKRLSYIKDPSTFCVKDFYGENNIESGLIAASTTTFNNQNVHTSSNQQQQPANKQDLNLSVYSQHSSVISTIKSGDSYRQPDVKANLHKAADDNECQDMQVTIDTMISESHPDNYETDLNNKEAIQANELKLHVFCFKLLDILLDSISKVSTMLPKVFETIDNLLNILNETKNEWSQLNVSQAIMVLFQKLNYHLKYWNCKDVNNFNRTIYIYLVNVFCNIINLMHSTNDTSLLLPSELTETLFIIINDLTLTESPYDQQINILIPLLNHLDSRLHEVYALSNEICDSLNDSCRFLTQYESLINKNPRELIELAESSLNCLDYHTCKLVPQYIVLFASNLMHDQELDKIFENNSHNKDIENLLINCMRSNCEQIRIDAYTQMTKIVTECINIDIACETDSKRYKRIIFILLKSVFYEIVSFGLHDSCAKVKECSKKIILYLLQCELFVSIEFHETLSQLFSVYMPFIQCEASQIEKLGQLIIQASDDTKEQLENGLLSSIEKLKSALRLMFMKEKNLRKIGYRQTVGFIIKDFTGDDNDVIGGNLNDFYLQYSPDKYSDMLVKLKKLKVFYAHEDSIFQTENLVRIYNIFASTTVDIDVKKNACEQLAIMISDNKLHKAFINLGGLDYCINLLRLSIKKLKTSVGTKEHETSMIINASCLTCICNVFYWNKDVRQKYLFDTQFYKLLFKFVIIFNSQQLDDFQTTISNIISSVQEDLSSILFLLLFHEISSLDKLNEDSGLMVTAPLTQVKKQFCLNSVILKSFTQVFEIYEFKRQLVDKNLKFNSIFKSLDNHIKEIVCEKFRINWNIKWHGGTLEQLIEDLLYNARVKNNSRLHIEFSENLVLTEKDKQKITSTNPHYVFKQLFDAINTSTTHLDALKSLDLIQILLLIDVETNSHYLKDVNWNQAINRFSSILPKTQVDQQLFSRTYTTLAKIIDYCSPFEHHSNFVEIDNWLIKMINDTESSFLIVFKRLCDNFDNDELNTSSHLIDLCQFLKKLYSNRNSNEDRNLYKLQVNKIFPIELVNNCMQHIRTCETIKFRNLNKLAILLEVFSSILKNQSLNDLKLQIQLVKSLIQIINSFHIGRGGLSLSFMGNSITKSSTLCLLEIINNLFAQQNQSYKVDLLKCLLCVKNECASLSGSSWLVPLLLHREPQIRALSFSITSLIVTVPFGRTKLLTYQNGIWTIALNVLLNRFESSIVRIEACNLLVNLLKPMINEDELNMPITSLQLLLQEHNFFAEIAILLTSFYPFDTYNLNAIISTQNQNISKNNLNLTMHTVNNHGNSNDVTISSPLLICSICQLLYNLTILLPEETLLSINNNGILRLLIGYMKPTLLNSNYDNIKLQYENMIDMLKNICNYLMLCCLLEKNCVIMFAKEEYFISDLIECLNVDGSKTKLKYFYSSIFDILGIFMNFDDISIVNHIINSLLKRWSAITNYLIEILSESSNIDDDLVENTLKFYSIYLSKISLSNGMQKLFDKISFIYDFKPEQPVNNTTTSKATLGNQLCELLIKKFDKHCFSDHVTSLKISIYNTLRTLLMFSVEAKNFALEAGFIETLVEQLKEAHTKVNLKALNSKSSLKDNTFLIDIKQILLVVKSFMCNSFEIKDEFVKYNLNTIIYSFWCWVLQDQNLLLATLSTLCTYTANNKHAAISLTQSANVLTTSTSILSSNSLDQNRGTSLLQSIIKVMSKFNTKYIIQKYGFSILINCAQVNECKTVISKSNFLQDFQNDVQQKINNKPNFKKEKLWLQFLANLSFSHEGQNMFMKIEGFLSCIIKCMDTSLLANTELHYLGLLILRNLSFNSTNKSKLLSHPEYLNVIIANLQQKDEKFIKLSISTIDTLLYEYQKAKVALKTANVIQYLADLIIFFKKKNDNKTLHILNNLIKVLNE